jgi:hypothetical protein
MMGVPQKLIMEANVSPVIEKGAKQLWNTIEELFSGGIERGTTKSLEKILTNLELAVGKNNVEALELISKGAEDVATKNTKIVEFLASNPVIKNNIERMLEANVTYTEALNKSIDKFIEDPEIKSLLDAYYIEALRSSGGNVVNARNAMRDVIEDFSEQEFDRYFNSVKAFRGKDGKFRIESKKPKIDDLPSEPRIDSAGNGQGVSSWSQKLGNVVLKTTKDVQKFIRELIGETSMSDIQDFTNIMKKTFHGPKMLQSEFNELMKTIERKITPGDPLFGQEYRDELYRAGILISSIRNTFNAQPKTFYDLWLASQPLNIQQILRTAPEGKVFQEFWNQVQKERKMLLPLATEFAAFRKAMPIAIRLFKEGKFNFQFWNPNFDWRRLRNLVLILDARTSREWRDILISRGATKDILATIAFRYLTASVLVPLYVQTLSFVSRGLGSFGELATNTILNLFGKEDVNWVDYNEEGLSKDKWLEIIKKEWFDKVTSEIDFKPYADLTNTTLKEFLKGQTLGDEVFNGLLAKYLTGGKDITPEDKENFNKELKEMAQKTQKEFEDWRNTLTPENKKYLEDLEKLNEKVATSVETKVNEIVNTEAGFKAFCLATKNAQFRTSNNIDKEYTFDGFGGMSGRTKEPNSEGTYEWYWDGKTFAPTPKD